MTVWRCVVCGVEQRERDGFEGTMLIRPGRVDLKVEFTKASESQLKRLYLRFFPNDTVGAARFAVEARGSTMAEAQEEILRRVQHGDSVRP